MFCCNGRNINLQQVPQGKRQRQTRLVKRAPSASQAVSAANRNMPGPPSSIATSATHALKTTHAAEPPTKEVIAGQTGRGENGITQLSCALRSLHNAHNLKSLQRTKRVERSRTPWVAHHPLGAQDCYENHGTSEISFEPDVPDFLSCTSRAIYNFSQRFSRRQCFLGYDDGGTTSKCATITRKPNGSTLCKCARMRSMQTNATPAVPHPRASWLLWCDLPTIMPRCHHLGHCRRARHLSLLPQQCPPLLMDPTPQGLLLSNLAKSSKLTRGKDHPLQPPLDHVCSRGMASTGM